MHTGSFVTALPDRSVRCTHGPCAPHHAWQVVKVVFGNNIDAADVNAGNVGEEFGVAVADYVYMAMVSSSGPVSGGAIRGNAVDGFLVVNGKGEASVAEHPTKQARWWWEHDCYLRK